MQKEIDAQVVAANKVKLSHGYSQQAAICKTWVSAKKFYVGV
jgi:hypothetical protein